MADVRRELQKLMSRGKSARNIEEPWWMSEYRTGKALSGFAEDISVGYDKSRQWNERKNLQRQQVMSELSRGTSMAFNDADLKKKEREIPKLL